MNVWRRVNWGNIKQFVTFNLVGLLNTVVDIVIFSLFIILGVPVAIAQIFGYGAGMISSYVGNSRFTFSKATVSAYDHANKKDVNHRKTRIWRFISWNGLMLLVTTLLIIVCTDYFYLPIAIAKAVTTVIVVLINFWGSKYWVFVSVNKQMIREEE